MSKTYDEIIQSLFASYQAQSGSAVAEDSDTAIKLRAVAGQLHALETGIDFVERQMSAATAVGEALTHHAAERGLTRRAGVKSAGTLCFYLTEPLWYNLVIPAGMTCVTDNEAQGRLVTVEEATLVAGEQSVDVAAEAEEVGYNGNVFSGTVCQVVNPPVSGLRVTNPDAFTGGADIEPDEDLRRRVLGSYSAQRTSFNKAYYTELALRHDGVGSAQVVSRARGRGTVNLYVAGYGDAVPVDTIAAIQAEVDREKECNVDVLVLRSLPRDYALTVQISVHEGFVPETVRDRVNEAITECVRVAACGQPLYLAAVTSATYAVPGVRNVKITSPLTDVLVANSEVPRLTGLTIQPYGAF